MRLLTLFAASLALLASFVKLENSDDEATAIFDSACPDQFPVRTRVTRRNCKTLPSTVAAPVPEEKPSGGKRKRNAKKPCVKEIQNFSKEQLLSALNVNANDNAKLLEKFESTDFSTFKSIEASEILAASIKNRKEKVTLHLLNQGVKLSFDTKELAEATTLAFQDALNKKKTDFFPTLMDFDPKGTTILLHNLKKHPATLELVRATLSNRSVIIDPEAIYSICELAAVIKFIELVQIIFETNSITRMIPSKSIVTLLSDFDQNDKHHIYWKVLQYVLNDRLITPPFAENILLQAAKDNSIGFIDSIETYLNVFTWSIVIKALNICLEKRHYYFASVLLRTNTYDSPDSAFHMCNRGGLLESIGKYANDELIERLLVARYYKNTTLLLSDDCIKKVCVSACYAGNLDVIDHLLRNDYLKLSMRFNGKSIFRMVLESGNSKLASFIIKYYGPDVIFDSDTPSYNPDGDSLIYVATNEQLDMFKYLIKLGANVNPKVRDTDASTFELIYWSIMNGQDQIAKALLDAGCEVDFSRARIYNSISGFGASRDSIEAALSEAQTMEN